MRLITILLMTLPLVLSAADDGLDAYHKHSMSQLKTTKGQDGEQYAWRAKYYADLYWKGYLVTKDTRWIDAAIELYDLYLSKNKKDPDGYYGTFGAGLGDKKTADFAFHHDTVVGDAIECMPITKLAEIILKDDALKAKYGEKANYYVDYADKMCFEKWNKRGCNYEDAFGYMSYHTYAKRMDPKKMEWVGGGHVISDNLNKHYDMATVLLRLYRIKGDEKYKKQVYKIYARAKRMFRYLRDEDRIVWNFWMPHGAYDLKGTAPASWVGVHSSRSGYQAGEVVQFIEAYDTGVVFTKEDFERMISTNVWMSKNGWKSADGTSKAGQLWHAFGRFDERIYEMATNKPAKDAKARIQRAYLKMEREHGWKRKYVKDDKDLMLYDFPVEDGKHIALASVIPSTLEVANNDRVRIIAQLRTSAPYKVELLDKSGTSLGTLHDVQFKTGASSYETFMWDGTNPKTGKKDLGTYTVQFTLGDEVRTWPVQVIKGSKKDKGDTFVLAQGKTVSYDFEGDLDTSIWKVGKEAKIVDGKGVDGSKALAIPPGNGASMMFGEYDDLKVKITFSIYDDGIKRGKKGGGGGYWGTKQANGNIFAFHRMWRGYLNGDKNYAWLNNGENQWFTPHPNNITRKQGWRTFVFDYTGDKPVFTCDGQALEDRHMNPKKFIPVGAVGINIGGPGHKMQPLYLDNVTIEYP